RAPVSRTAQIHSLPGLVSGPARRLRPRRPPRFPGPLAAAHRPTAAGGVGDGTYNGPRQLHLRHSPSTHPRAGAPALRGRGMSELATVVWAAAVFMLFWLDRDGASDVSRALWIPFAWMFLAGSRMVSEWLYPGWSVESPDALIDGSPLDRFVVSALLVIGLGVLLGRGRRVNAILRANMPLLA